MRTWLRPWVLSVAGYGGALLLVGVLLAGRMGAGGAGASWAFLIVPPLLGVVAGTVTLRPRTRPTWHAGVVVAAPVALLSLALGLAAAARAWDALAPGVGATMAAVPLVVALIAGAGTGMLVARAWTPPASPPPPTASYLGGPPA